MSLGKNLPSSIATTPTEMSPKTVYFDRQSSVSSDSRPSAPSSAPEKAAPPTEAAGARINSDVSNISDMTRTHLRGISDSSVSTDSAWAPAPFERLARDIATTSPADAGSSSNDERRPSAVSPVTPSAGDGGLQSQRRQPSSARRSNFAESLDEVNE